MIQLKRFLPFLFLTVVTWSVCGFAAAPTPGSPLLPNGNLETDADGDGWPDQWARPARSHADKTQCELRS